MALVDELAQLHELQKIDTQIYQREQACKMLDSGEGLKRVAIEAMKRHDAAVAGLRKVEAAQKDRDLELKSLEQKRAKVKEKLYSGKISNPKELGDLEKDVEMLSHQVASLDEVVLELMDKVETGRASAQSAEAELADAKRRWTDAVAYTKKETARLQQELAALRPERERAAAGVEKMLLRRYEDIRQRREGVGMAVTGNDSCPACHVKLDTRIMLRLRACDELTTCENCGRILLGSFPCEAVADEE